MRELLVKSMCETSGGCVGSTSVLQDLDSLRSRLLHVRRIVSLPVKKVNTEEFELMKAIMQYRHDIVGFV